MSLILERIKLTKPFLHQLKLLLLTLSITAIFSLSCSAKNNETVIQGNVSTTVTQPINGSADSNDDSLRLSRPNNLNAEDNASNLNTNSNNSGVLKIEVSKQELRMLGQHDVTLLIDKSGSMDTRDCPSPSKSGKFAQYLNIPLMLTIGTNPFEITRWHWCQIQTMHFADISKNYLDNGMTVVLFSSTYKVFQNVHFNDIETIFQVNKPSGGTNTTAALVSVIRHYFESRQNNPDTKPIVIAIITDGVPDNPITLKEAIIEATFRMRNPNEISIAFLQIGGSFFGYNYLKELDFGLMAQGAKYDIVSVKTFGELTKIGLARGFIDAIEDNQKANAQFIKRPNNP